MSPLSPAAKTRLLFYLVFTCFGLFHAEVLSRSQPWVLINPLSFLLVAPVYAVHYVVLGDLLLRRRATGFFPVFIAGCILGMYEFAITKVFWNPTWAPLAPRVMDVAWMEVLWVGFWWHAFMSFAVPFFLVRKLVLERHPHPLQIREVRYVLVGVPAVSATFGVAFGAPPVELLASTLLSLVVLLAVARLFLLKAPAWGFKGPEDVLLGRTGRRRALAFLVAVYLFYGALMRPDAWPSPAGFVLPALLYGALFLMFYPFVRGARAPATAAAAAAMPAVEDVTAPAAVPTPAALPTVAAVPPAAPTSGAHPQPLAPPALAPTDGLRNFLVRYALSFVALISVTEAVALTAPWALLVATILMVLGSTAGAALLLVAAGGKSLRRWAARGGAAGPA